MNSFNAEAHYGVLNKELNEEIYRGVQRDVRLNRLDRESADNRDRDVKMMGILREMSEALEVNTKTAAVIKKQIGKLFHLAKGKKIPK